MMPGTLLLACVASGADWRYSNEVGATAVDGDRRLNILIALNITHVGWPHSL